MPRLWRTADGDLVEDGHPDAKFLAYGDGDEVPEGEQVRGKKSPPAANKKSPAPANKAK